MYDNMFPILSWRRIIIDGKPTPYIISSEGVVMNDCTGKMLLYTLDKDNYPTVKLNVDGVDTVYKVHRLCCDAFNSNPFNLNEVDHIDRNHWNISKDNLEYVTGEENHNRLNRLREIEKAQLGNYKEVAAKRHRYTDTQILQVCLRLTKKEKISKISKKTGVDSITISKIKSFKIWRHISCYFSFDDSDGGIINDEILDKLYYYIDNGFTNTAIIKILDINNEEYFTDIINQIRKSR